MRQPAAKVGRDELGPVAGPFGQVDGVPSTAVRNSGAALVDADVGLKG